MCAAERPADHQAVDFPKPPASLLALTASSAIASVLRVDREYLQLDLEHMDTLPSAKVMKLAATVCGYAALVQFAGLVASWLSRKLRQSMPQLAE